MVDVLWWMQVTGQALSIILTAGAILAALYSTFREAPKFVRRLTGVDTLDTNVTGLRAKVDQLLADHLLSQELQRQQAEAFNDLKETVCEEHDIPESERPAGMDLDTINDQIIEDDTPDFTRGQDDDDD